LGWEQLIAEEIRKRLDPTTGLKKSDDILTP
jgi:hypothetical protein